MESNAQVERKKSWKGFYSSPLSKKYKTIFAMLKKLWKQIFKSSKYDL